MIDLIIGLAEIVLSLFLGFLTVWFAFKRFARLTREIDEMGALKENNVAAGILLGSTILSVGLVVRQAASPAISSLQTIIHKGLTFLGALKVIGIALASIVVVLIVALAAIWTAVRLFLKLTKDIDELAEIRRNNVAVAIVLGAVIIVIGIFLGQGIQSLLATLIPFPAFSNIQVM